MGKPQLRYHARALYFCKTLAIDAIKLATETNKKMLHDKIKQKRKMNSLVNVKSVEDVDAEMKRRAVLGIEGSD